MLGRRVMERRVKTGTKGKERTRIKIVKVSVYVCEVGGGLGGGGGGGRCWGEESWKGGSRQERRERKGQG